MLFEADQDHSMQGQEQGVLHSTDPTEGKMKVLEKKKAAWGTAAEDKDWGFNRLLRSHYIPFWIFSTGLCHLTHCQQLIFLISLQYLPREENAAYILISAPLLAQKVEEWLVSLKVQSYWLGRWNSVGFHQWESLFLRFFFLKKKEQNKTKGILLADTRRAEL